MGFLFPTGFMRRLCIYLIHCRKNQSLMYMFQKHFQSIHFPPKKLTISNVDFVMIRHQPKQLPYFLGKSSLDYHRFAACLIPSKKNRDNLMTPV